MLRTKDLKTKVFRGVGKVELYSYLIQIISVGNPTEYIKIQLELMNEFSK
jgi:hypothetical protein